jgi:hypothetical protein
MQDLSGRCIVGSGEGVGLSSCVTHKIWWYTFLPLLADGVTTPLPADAWGHNSRLRTAPLLNHLTTVVLVGVGANTSLIVTAPQLLRGHHHTGSCLEPQHWRGRAHGLGNHAHITDAASQAGAIVIEPPLTIGSSLSLSLSPHKLQKNQERRGKWTRVSTGAKVLFCAWWMWVIHQVSTNVIMLDRSCGLRAWPMGSQPMWECVRALFGWAECGLLRSAEIILGQRESFGLLSFIFNSNSNFPFLVFITYYYALEN